MKFVRIPFGIAVGALILLATSATTPKQSPATGLSVGDVIPEMKTEVEAYRSLKPEANTGNYTLVHFWATYDATSRRDNVDWSRFFAQHHDQCKVSYRPISIDPDSVVYDATLRLDGVDAKQQAFAGGTARNQTIATFGLQQTFATYLVDDRGVIVAVNPTSEELEQSYLH